MMKLFWIERERDLLRGRETRQKSRVKILLLEFFFFRVKIRSEKACLDKSIPFSLFLFFSYCYIEEKRD